MEDLVWGLGLLGSRMQPLLGKERRSFCRRIRIENGRLGLGAWVAGQQDAAPPWGLIAGCEWKESRG